MPYVKCLSVHSTPARSIAYIVNKDKTDNLIYVTGLNCSAVPTLAYDEMKSVFENYSKDRFDEKKSEDKNLYYKALIHMREDAKLEFVDTKLGDEYKTYVNNYK